MLWVNSMSQYKIEKRTKYATDGTIISTVWDIYDEEGRVIERGLDSEEIAQGIVEMHKTRNELKKIKTNIIHKNDSKP